MSFTWYFSWPFAHWDDTSSNCIIRIQWACMSTGVGKTFPIINHHQLQLCINHGLTITSHWLPLSIECNFYVSWVPCSENFFRWPRFLGRWVALKALCHLPHTVGSGQNSKSPKSGMFDACGPFGTWSDWVWEELYGIVTTPDAPCIVYLSCF